MYILESVENLYSLFENKDLDIEDLYPNSKEFIYLTDFNNIVTEKPIDENEILKIINFIKDKNDSIISFIIDTLLINKSFFKNETVKEIYHSIIEDRIYEDIDSFNLNGNKLKIVDLFYNDDIKGIETLMEDLDDESKIDILMYIMEYSYQVDVLDENSEISKILNQYQDLVDYLYE